MEQRLTQHLAALQNLKNPLFLSLLIIESVVCDFRLRLSGLLISFCTLKRKSFLDILGGQADTADRRLSFLVAQACCIAATPNDLISSMCSGLIAQQFFQCVSLLIRL
jgi:hypothetical protein